MDKGAQEKVTSHLFSEEERRNIVRSFIEAYVRGTVKIHYPTKEEAELYKEELQAVLGEIDTSKVEFESKDTFSKQVLIATGAWKATQNGVQDAIDTLFHRILAFRQSERIEGEFLQAPNLQSRLASLEEKVAEIERLLEELQNLIRIRGQRS